MEHFTLSHQGTYIVSEYLKIHYRYFNNTKPNNYVLLRESIKGNQIKILGSGYHMMILH